MLHFSKPITYNRIFSLETYTHSILARSIFIHTHTYTHAHILTSPHATTNTTTLSFLFSAPLLLTTTFVHAIPNRVRHSSVPTLPYI